MADFELPLGVGPVNIQSGNGQQLNVDSPTLVALGQGGAPNEHLVFVTEWGINLVDKDGIPVGLEEDKEVAGAELIEPSELTLAWFRGEEYDTIPLKENQYFYNRIRPAERVNVFKIISTDYNGPVGSGSILVKEIGKPKQSTVSTKSKTWFDEFSQDVLPLEKITESSTMVVE